MNIFKKYLIVFVLLAITSLQGFAQTKAVQLSIIASPPYPLYLTDYANTSGEKLNVQLFLTDLNAQRDVYLKLTVTGPDIEFSTKDNLFNQPSYSLVGGVPYVLYQSDLNYYFNFSNIKGISLQKL